MSQTAILLANLALASSKCREKSYNHAASDLATAKGAAERKANPDDLCAGMIDYSKFYGLTKREACEKTCDEANEPLLALPVFLLLDSWWNDTLDWALNTASGQPSAISDEL